MTGGAFAGHPELPHVTPECAGALRELSELPDVPWATCGGGPGKRFAPRDPPQAKKGKRTSTPVKQGGKGKGGKGGNNNAKKVIGQQNQKRQARTPRRRSRLAFRCCAHAISARAHDPQVLPGT